jgi:transposase-like protein
MTLVNHFRSEQLACLYLESHIWNDHAICPHCHEEWRIGRLDGLTTTKGTWKCYRCRKPFSARRNTFFEGSHIQLHVWLQGLYILAGTQFQIGANRLSMVLGISLRSAGHLKHKVLALIPQNAQGMMPIANSNGFASAPHSDDTAVMMFTAGTEKSHDGQQSQMMPSTSCRSTISTSFKHQPPSGTSELRFQRFLAAIEGFNIAQTDEIFERIFPHLLATSSHAPASSKPASDQPLTVS